MVEYQIQNSYEYVFPLIIAISLAHLILFLESLLFLLRWYKLFITVTYSILAQYLHCFPINFIPLTLLHFSCRINYAAHPANPHTLL